jgi:N-acetylglutamate synthase-like GNAT family acetyltransferase
MDHNIISKHNLKGKNVICKYISFEEILPYWHELWPGRISEIKPLSSIQYCGRTDMSIYEKATPSFFAIEVDGEIIAVGAGFSTTETLYRGRGLWVREDFRGLGYGRRMLALMCRQCRIEGRMKTWGLITTETEGFYSKVKFILTSDEIKNEVDEDGPYYFMIRDSYEPMKYMGDWEGVEDVIESRPEDFNGAVEYCGTDGKPIEYDDIDPIEFLNGTDI